MRYKFFLYIFLGFLGGSMFFNTASSVKYDGTLQDSITTPLSDSLNMAAGKKLYESKCGKCHALFKPKEYKMKQWKENLDDMMNKAELKEDEYKLIFAYLKENCRK
jgi:mono/diheme cytochrome c family protein